MILLCGERWLTCFSTSFLQLLNNLLLVRKSLSEQLSWGFTADLRGHPGSQPQRPELAQPPLPSGAAQTSGAGSEASDEFEEALVAITWASVFVNTPLPAS